MTFNRRHLLGLLTAMSSLFISATAQADAYPSKPVTLMVPYPAGGLSDVIARTVNNTLSKNLGQPVIVDNLGGASGCLLYTSPSPRDAHESRMPSSA